MNFLETRFHQFPRAARGARRARSRAEPLGPASRSDVQRHSLVDCTDYRTVAHARVAACKALSRKVVHSYTPVTPALLQRDQFEMFDSCSQHPSTRVESAMMIVTSRQQDSHRALVPRLHHSAVHGALYAPLDTALVLLLLVRAAREAEAGRLEVEMSGGLRRGIRRKKLYELADERSDCAVLGLTAVPHEH